MIQSASSNETIKQFHSLESMIRRDLLLSAVRNLSSSMEAFIINRTRFASSLAVFSICGYILGIGDRHLENFLVDTKDCRIIGIDFGMSFGSGIDLPVPELMPMRFSRQFQYLLHPLDSTSLTKQSMCHVLKILKANRHILIDILKVFVKEPHLDWKSQAMKYRLRVDDGSSEVSEDVISKMGLSDISGGVQSVSLEDMWYINKLAIVEKKLSGWNSAAIMEQELLKSVHADKHYLKDLIELVSGDSRRNIRSKLARSGLTISEQIDCLIDHACDPNILGRTWQGWAAFV